MQDGSNSVDVQCMARRHDRAELQKACEHFIAYNFDEVETSEAFKQLGKDEQDSLMRSRKTLGL